MIARSLLIASIASGSLIAASSAMAQYVPLGSVMNAIGNAGAASSSPNNGQVSGKEQPQRVKTPPTYPGVVAAPSGPPARRKHPANRSQDND